jgi:hypothetical protein
MENIKMSFKDAPVGARFKYPNDTSGNIWVKLNSHPKSSFENGLGLICKWEGNIKSHQSFCSFSDEYNGISFETEIELL